jgi:hypothetical protein
MQQHQRLTAPVHVIEKLDAVDERCRHAYCASSRADWSPILAAAQGGTLGQHETCAKLP